MGNKAFKGQGHALGSGGGGTRAGVDPDRQRQQREQRGQPAGRAQQPQAGTMRSAKAKQGATGREAPKTGNLNQTVTKPRTASETAAVRSAAAAAADARANAWDNRSAKGRKERERKRRENHDRMAVAAVGAAGGTATASARASHAGAPAPAALKVDLGGFDPTQTVITSSTAVQNGMMNESADVSRAGLNCSSGNDAAAGSGGGVSGGSIFSSSLLDHHTAVDQNEVDRLMPLLTKSSIRQRNEAFSATAPALPDNMDDIVRICSVGNDASPDLALALVMNHTDRAAAAKAVKMVQTLLANILQHPSEEKYRSVRLCNKAIQRRLCGVPGAIDLLAAAGFVICIDGEAALADPRLVFPELASREKLEAAVTSATLALSQMET